VVLPWVQQYPLVAGLVVRAAGDGTEGTLDLEADSTEGALDLLEADQKEASSVNRATSSASEGRTVAASAVAVGVRMFLTVEDWTGPTAKAAPW
jgi:hypothetical protein